MDDERIQVNPQTTQVDDLQLIALPSAVNCTDLFAQFTLTEWSLRALKDDAAQTAGKLVQAAVDSADPDSPGFITVRLRLRGDGLVIEVEDQVPHPASKMPSLEGLRTGVEALGGGGKLVWCEMPLPDGVTASAVPLPRREQRKQPASEPNDETVEVDPQVMQRLLSGLSGTSRDKPE